MGLYSVPFLSTAEHLKTKRLHAAKNLQDQSTSVKSAPPHIIEILEN